MVQYKVWVSIEKIDEALDILEDCGLPDPLGTFDTLEQAQELVTELLETYNPDAILNSEQVKFREYKGD